MASRYIPPHNALHHPPLILQVSYADGYTINLEHYSRPAAEAERKHLLETHNELAGPMEQVTAAIIRER